MFSSRRYNCRQEFQIHDDILKTNYKVGRISDAMPEHYLVQVGEDTQGQPPSFSLLFSHSRVLIAEWHRNIVMRRFMMWGGH